MKVPAGTHWSPPVLSSSYRGNELAAGVDPPNPEKPSHVEADKFDGDWVLDNSVLFLEDFGWWIEAAYVIPEGDMGRVNEILKVFFGYCCLFIWSAYSHLQIWIFTFAGSSNQNYKDYMLKLYCLLRYEASKDLKNAILNNLLVNLMGELGKWIEGDLMQEHYNCWLEDIVMDQSENCR